MPDEENAGASPEPVEGEAAARLSEQDRARIDAFRSKHATELLVIVFTDLVGSAALKSELGDEAYKDLDDEHKRLLLDTLAGFTKAQVIRVEGDAYIFVFLKPSDAVRFVLSAQAVHRRARAGGSTRLPQFRVGIHLGTVVVEEGLHGPRQPGGIGDIKGLQADMTARIMGLADGGQVLCSRAVFDDARQALKGAELEGLGTLAWVSHGLYLLKGRDDPLEVCEVGEEGVAAFIKPPGNEKARPADVSDEELGWRPAVGVVVPGTDWELEAKLGEGEFGEVWLGRNRTTGERQVYKFCFKRERVAWLKREARLLIELRKRLPGHPNIVAFRDIMTEHDRPPYYITMEYVDGPSLDEWLATNPPLAQRLELIAQVAAGLDAVHAEGIYHRDVKPSNLLLERKPDGTIRAKLSDFGLGTAEDESLLRSVYASRVEGLAGTWDYIAPEMREGKPASAQSDIYALGLTLYQVVVGDLHRPLASGWERQIESDVLREDIARCTDADPAERWPRARELATALRTHDERVRRRLLERERAEHHKRVVRFRIVTAISGAFAIVMLVFGSLAWFQRYEALRQRAVALEQRAIAEEQRDRAVRQKEIAIAAVKKLTYDVPERFKDIPGTLAPLRELQEMNVATLDQILALDPDTPEAQQEKCANLVGIGKSWLELGDSPKALSAFESAHAIAEKLVKAEPASAAAKKHLADSAEGLGDAYLRLGRSTEAKAAFEAARGIRAELAAAPDADAETKRNLAASYNRLGGMYLTWGRLSEALEAQQAAFDILKALADAEPDDEENQRALGDAYNSLGDVYVALQRNDDAVAAYETGVDLTVGAAPEGPERQKLLAAGYGRLGSVYYQLGSLDKALATFESALEAVNAYAAANPESVVARRGQAVVYNNIGDVQLAKGKHDEALNAYTSMIDIVTGLAASDPASTEAQRDLAVCHNRLGEAYAAMERTNEALEQYEAALEIVKTLAGNSESLIARRDLAVSYNRVAGLYYAQGRTDEALEAMQAALAISKELTEADPTNPQWQQDVVSNSGAVGEILFHLGRTDEALDTYRAMLKLADDAVAADPDDPDAYHWQASGHNGVGDVLLATGHTADALAAFESMVESARKKLELTPDDETAQQTLALANLRLADACLAFGSKDKAADYFAEYFKVTTKSPAGSFVKRLYPYWGYMRLGDGYMQAGRAEAALDAYQQMQAVADTIVKVDPSNTISQQWLAWAYERQANACDKLGRTEEAEQARAKAKAITDKLPKSSTSDSEG